MLDLLEDRYDRKIEVHKNLFFKTRPIAAPTPRQEHKTRKQDRADAPAPAVPHRESLVQRVKKDLSRFTVFGTYTTGHERAVFFEKGKQILVVREGDRIEGKYKVEKITPQSIIVKAESINERVHIDMSAF